MRALNLLPCRFWGGPEKQTLRLSGWLRDYARVETIFAVMPTDAASLDGNPLLLRAREAGFESAPFVQSRRYDLIEGVRLLRRLVSRYRPDVVCATGYKADVLAAWLGATPSVATLRGWTAQDAKVRFFEWLDRRTLRRHDSVIVVSHVLRDAAIRAGVAPQRVFWVPNAIDPAQLPSPRQREDLCREIGADPERPLLAAVGRLSPEKGQRVLVDAFSRVRHRLPGSRLAIVGDGPEEASLRGQVETLGLAQDVTFMGLRADGQQIIGALDALALPSFSEGMPNVLLEAFAYGTPVVATRVGGVPDMLSDGDSGWLVSPGDAEGLAFALVEALADASEARRRAARARSILAERFTVERQARAWLSAVNAAIDTKPASTADLSLG
jgi:glycosyltransferase involved in cell wall biosynthesis